MNLRVSQLIGFGKSGIPGSTGFIVAGAGANNADAGDATWVSPDGVIASDNNYAASTLTAGQTSWYLHATSFGHSLPAAATVTGIEVRIERRDFIAADRTKDHTVQLIKAGTRQGDNKADTSIFWPAADTNKDYGAANDLWGLTLTKAQVEASNFGVAVRAENVHGSSSGQPSVDAIWTNIHYLA